MISEVIQHLNAILSGMPYFTEVYGLSELKRNKKDVIVPVHYVDGKWEALKTNKYGMTYWRKTGDVPISGVESYSQCGNDYEFNYPLRLFCMTKRSQFPSNDAYSGDRLASTIMKAITMEGGDLKRTIGARKLSIAPTIYSTKSESILQQEFSGLNISDYKHIDLVIALDVDVNITMPKPCIEDPCDYVPQFCLLLEQYVALP